VGFGIKMHRDEKFLSSIVIHFCTLVLIVENDSLWELKNRINEQSRPKRDFQLLGDCGNRLHELLAPILNVLTAGPVFSGQILSIAVDDSAS
jgi:hypothetical protein